MNIAGELWADEQGCFVRDGADFYRCGRHLLPRGAREYDAVKCTIDSKGRVLEIQEHVPEEVIQRPKGFRPPRGVFVGKVTAYRPNQGGLIDYELPFSVDAVKALGAGEASVGEIIEYTIREGKVSKVTGPFDTHVSKTGARLN